MISDALVATPAVPPAPLRARARSRSLVSLHHARVIGRAGGVAERRGSDAPLDLAVVAGDDLVQT